MRNAALAADFYRRALGAEELYSSPLPGGIGLHVHLKIGDTMVMVTDETPENLSAQVEERMMAMMAAAQREE